MDQPSIGRHFWRRYFVACGLVALVLVGCTGGYRAKKWLDSDSSVMIQDMTEAAAKGDRSHLERMVEALDADDPAVRFYAIESLRKLTGQDLDYVYYNDTAARQPAVMRWKQWLADNGRGTAGVASTAPTTTLGATR